MKRLYKITAVTLVTALFILGSSLNAFAVDTYMFVTQSYPDSESLIYGTNTIVVDINLFEDSSDDVFSRYQLNSGSRYWIQQSYSGGKYVYSLFLLSNSLIYNYAVSREDAWNDTARSVYSTTNAFGYNYMYVEEVSFYDDDVFICNATMNSNRPSNASIGSGYTEFTNIHVISYPSASYLQNIKEFEKLHAEMSEGFSSVNNAITQAVDDIINAGSNMPGLDTDNSWMNDSLTKVNEWVSSLESFEEQMDAAEEENAENMANAKTFLSSFFSKIPKGIIAVLTLALVMIVAVKVVGR